MQQGLLLGAQGEFVVEAARQGEQPPGSKAS
jgi:hypothetical protein